MGFLSPLFLVAASFILVPLFLHLLYRQESKTFLFPAIRYLLRTEQDHARQIRTQQLLLLVLRIGILLLLVSLGARIHFPGPGGAHEPTALALVVDNSLSTTLIENGGRRLEALKAVARASTRASGPGDVIWVIEAGSPWSTSSPESGSDALARIDEIEPSHGPADLGATLTRALALVDQSDLPAREVHLFTDLQATGFPHTAVGGEETPIVVFGLSDAATRNRGIGRVTIGGGLPPLANRRSEAVVELNGTGDDTVGVRLYIDGHVRAATSAPVGATVRLPIGPFPPGRVEGFVEIDPDPLTADDRHFFAFTVREPTAVASLGSAPFFVDQALAVLQDDGRILVGGAGRAQTILSAGGVGLTARDRSQSAVVYPLGDPALLPALNRVLAEAGIPYRYESVRSPEARVTTTDLGVGLENLRISTYFRLIPGRAEDAGEAVASLSNGDPWIVEGNSPLGSYVLLASPLDNESTTLPVSASMIPLLEWALDRWPTTAGGSTAMSAGAPYTPPATATHVRIPGGDRHAVDGNQPFLATREVGMYYAMGGEDILDAVAANAPPAESDLRQLTSSELRRVVPGVTTVVDQASAWTGTIFKAGRGPEPWRPLLLLVLILLAVESSVAASGRVRKGPPETPSSPRPSG